MDDHPNFVLFVEDDHTTTIGGNENYTISIQTLPLDKSRSSVRFAKKF